MNHYGQSAMERLRRLHPDRYTQLQDPAGFFTSLGEHLQAEVTATRDRILGPQRLGETLEAFRARALQALRTAEELVLADLDLVPPPVEAVTAPDPTLEAYRRSLREANEAIAADPAG